MTATCRCGAWKGSPKFNVCTGSDCELRYPKTLLPESARNQIAGSPSAGDGVPVPGSIVDRVYRRACAGGLPVSPAGVSFIARLLDEERASDGEANRLIGANETGAIHEKGMADAA